MEEISATTVGLVFEVEEGKRVRVKEIQFMGERDGFSQRRLRGAMKLVKEAGLFSNFTSKDIYFKERNDGRPRAGALLPRDEGYLQAKLGEPKVEEAGKVSSGLPLPLFRKSGPGLKISIPIEVGRPQDFQGRGEGSVDLPARHRDGLLRHEGRRWVDSRRSRRTSTRGSRTCTGRRATSRPTSISSRSSSTRRLRKGRRGITLEVEEDGSSH